jgi:hypothetical protein
VDVEATLFVLLPLFLRL